VAPRVFVCTLLALLLSSTVSGAPAKPKAKSRSRRSIEVQGHRGARALRPENTMAAFRYAVGLGVDTLELDLQVTRDDVLVVAHDAHISPARCLDAKGRKLVRPLAIRRLTARQVTRFDCGSLAHPRFPRQRRVPRARIPRFGQVLRLVGKHARVQINVETKLVPGRPELAPTPQRFAALVVAELRRHKLLERSTLQSFDYRTLTAARRIAPKLRIVLLTAGNSVDYVQLARRYRATTVSPHHAWITAGDVKRLHAAGVRVVPWTANSERVWRRLITAGVDGIITDDPAALLRYLRARKLR
jgi:glycerophosphoryl diester phosphodiesterase